MSACTRAQVHVWTHAPSACIQASTHARMHAGTHITYQLVSGMYLIENTDECTTHAQNVHAMNDFSASGAKVWGQFWECCLKYGVRPIIRQHFFSTSTTIIEFLSSRFQKNPDVTASEPRRKQRPVSLLRLSILRFVDSEFQGNSLWTSEFQPSNLRSCLSQTLWNPES